MQTYTILSDDAEKKIVVIQVGNLKSTVDYSQCKSQDEVIATLEQVALSLSDSQKEDSKIDLSSLINQPLPIPTEGK